MVKIYTKTGDKGTSGLYDGNRLPKDSIVFDVLGEIDELSSHIGMLYALLRDPQCRDENQRKIDLKHIQSLLQNIGSEIATVNRENRSVVLLDEEEITTLEERIDDMTSKLPKLTAFILPGLNRADAQAHICRSVCRRVERSLWRLDNDNQYVQEIPVRVNQTVLRFMNRLSDYFFTLGRFLAELELEL